MSDPDTNLIETDFYSSTNISVINIPQTIDKYLGLEESVETINQGLIHIKKELDNLIIENKELIKTNENLITEKISLLNKIDNFINENKELELKNKILLKKIENHKPFFFF
jgi:predicted nuclease with TOPRIM domain